MINFLYKVARFLCMCHLKTLYVIGQTAALPFFLGITFSGITLYKGFPLLYNTSFGLILYYSIGSFLLALYLNNPTNLLQAETFVGKEYLHANLSHTPPGLKEAAVGGAALGLGAMTIWSGTNLFRERMVFKQDMEVGDRIGDIGKEAQKDGDWQTARYARIAAIDLYSIHKNLSEKIHYKGAWGTFASSAERWYVPPHTSDEREGSYSKQNTSNPGNEGAGSQQNTSNQGTGSQQNTSNQEGSSQQEKDNNV